MLETSLQPNIRLYFTQAAEIREILKEKRHADRPLSKLELLSRHYSPIQVIETVATVGVL